MLIPIKINVAPLIQEYSLSHKQVEDMLDNVVKGVTARFAQKLEKVVEQNLGSTRTIFTNAIKVIDTGKLMGRVLIDYSQNKLIKKIEEGSPAWDMKPALLASPKAKTTKSGSRYISVPFKWGNSEAVTMSNVMPEEIYEVAKTLKDRQYITFNSLPSDFQSLQSRDEITDSAGKTLFEKYTHKNSIFQGIQKTTDSVTGQNTYNSFRRVSEKSNPSAWIHPGFKAQNFMDKALAQMNIPQISGELIDQELDRIGL
jgi:hypothetical protein